uniref:Putative family s33 unassigned peptidase n=1 Tax=Ixodes ricinus TaxID=34613 RepID=A0A6B0UW81_IXORI
MSPPWHLGGFVLIATAACGLSPLVRSKGQEPLYTGNDPDACKDISRMPVYLCKLPAGTSMKNLQHFLQAEPPLYSLDTMTTDVGTFWSLGDKLVFPDTVAQLIKDLGPRVKKNVYIDDPDYTHINFVNALINPEVLFPDLLEFLARYLGRPCKGGPT